MIAVQVLRFAQLDLSRFEQTSPIGILLAFWIIVIFVSARRWIMTSKLPKGNEGSNDNRTRAAQVATIIGVIGLLVTFATAPNIQDFGASIAGLFGNVTIGDVTVDGPDLLLIAIVVIWVMWFTKPAVWKLIVAGLLTLAGIVVSPALNSAAVLLMNTVGAFLFNVFFVYIPNFLLGFGR